MGFGRVIGGLIAQRFFNYFGYKKSLLMIALLLSLQSFLMLVMHGFLLISASFFVCGVVYFLLMNSANLLISSKYPGEMTQIKYLNMF